MTKVEIGNGRGGTVKRDAYALQRDRFPAGVPGRVASTMSRRDDDVPPVTTPRPRAAEQPTTAQRISATAPTNTTDAEKMDKPVELQQVVAPGKLEGGDDDKRKQK